MILYAPYKYTLKGNSGSIALVRLSDTNGCNLEAVIPGH